MEKQKLLFLFLCIPVRLLLVYISYKLNQRLLEETGATSIFIHPKILLPL